MWKLINISERNKTGPRTEPWGTPILTLRGLDYLQNNFFSTGEVRLKPI